MSETEADTRADRIDPVLRAAGWGEVPGARVQRELICPGRITGGGGRVSPLSADYVLSYRDRKLAVIEAKRAGLGHTDGIGQAKDYATRLQTRMAYATNGIGWYGVDMATGAEGDLALPFPSPQDLWERCFPLGNDWRDRFGAVPFETGGGKWEPRYYQHNAITAVLEAIAQGRRRILLTLATGTGKTSIAFQIAWKLFHASWNLSATRCAARASCSWPIATSSPIRPITRSAPFRPTPCRGSAPTRCASTAGSRRTPISSSRSSRPS